MGRPCRRRDAATPPLSHLHAQEEAERHKAVMIQARQKRLRRAPRRPGGNVPRYWNRMTVPKAGM